MWSQSIYKGIINIYEEEKHITFFHTESQNACMLRKYIGIKTTPPPPNTVNKYSHNTNKHHNMIVLLTKLTIVHYNFLHNQEA